MRLFPAMEPFAALAIDFLGPLPRTPEGYEYILVTCDRFTRVTRAVLLRATTALDVSARSSTSGSPVMGYPTQCCRIMDRSSPPYYGEAC